MPGLILSSFMGSITMSARHYSVGLAAIFTEAIHLTEKLTEEIIVFDVFFTPDKSHPQHG